jgi:hypothetical protein
VRIDPDEVVDGVVVRRQFHGLGVDQGFPDDVRLVVRPELAQRVAHPGLVDDRDAQQVGLQRAGPIQVVGDLLDGVGMGVVILYWCAAD